MNSVQASPWQDVFTAPPSCKKVSGAPLVSTGNGAALLLVGIAIAYFVLDRKVPR